MIIKSSSSLVSTLFTRNSLWVDLVTAIVPCKPSTLHTTSDMGTHTDLPLYIYYGFNVIGLCIFIPINLLVIRPSLLMMTMTLMMG